MSEDTRPTSAQFKRMSYADKRALTRPVNTEGEYYTPEMTEQQHIDNKARKLKGAVAKRLKFKAAKNETHTQQSFGITAGLDSLKGA